MRALVQRVSRASVNIGGSEHASIGRGMLIFLGIEPSDSEMEAGRLAQKLAALRIFSDSNGKMNLSMSEVEGKALVASQFTLLASTKKGNRPSFVRAAPPDMAIPLYRHFYESLSSFLGSPVETGLFGADMEVLLINDGPVTLWFDTNHPE